MHADAGHDLCRECLRGDQNNRPAYTSRAGICMPDWTKCAAQARSVGVMAWPLLVAPLLLLIGPRGQRDRAIVRKRQW